MTKRQYKAIAEILNKYDTIHAQCQCSGITEMIMEIANYFESDNPNFNRKLFMRAVRGEK
jgi:hypothetical protein